MQMTIAIAAAAITAGIVPVDQDGDDLYVKRASSAAHLATVKGAHPDAPVIDATGVFDEMPTFKDHSAFTCVLPPWETAWIGMRYEPGGYAVSLVTAQSGEAYGSPNPDEDDVIHVWTWMAHHDHGIAGPTEMSFVTYNKETGAVTDMRACNIAQEEIWGWPTWVMLGTYNLLNCRNIELKPKPMTRQERRRHQRQPRHTTIESVLHIKPTGTRHTHNPTTSTDSPTTRLHSVRGHIAHYGNCCPGQHEPRGLLFGQQNGRIWVPQHARGNIENGRTNQTFIVEQANADRP